MTQPKNLLIRLALAWPRLVTWLMLVSTAVLVALATVPSLWPAAFPALNPLVVDTDPENMLAADEPVRVFHNRMKAEFALNDIVVLGIVNEDHPDGVFNPDSLGRIYELTRFAATLQWPDPEAPEKTMGVVTVDMIAPSMVDSIEQRGLGAVSFDWLMPRPPRTRQEALAVRDRAQRLPMLDGTLLSEDGKALSLYLPLTHKHLSYRVREALLDRVSSWEGTGDVLHITGLPVAEDIFGVEMFIQMAISAPAAMAVIFLLMWIFFRNLRLIVSPMIIAMVCSMSTMALLVATGNTIHIMSSMIPIFIMPIAVLDAVHILSEFFDRYRDTGDRRATIVAVMDELYKPMLFTSLTTSVGFASLALTPIPPVQVFGVFVTVGVMLAWFWTITFVPAFIMFIPEAKLAGFGRQQANGEGKGDWLSRALSGIGRFSHGRPRFVLLAVLALAMLSAFGISRIVINDNPIKWFEEDHPIRVADKVLNDHFAGTYMAFLALTPGMEIDSAADYRSQFERRLSARESGLEGVTEVFAQLRAEAVAIDAATRAEFLDLLGQRVAARLDAAPDDLYQAWDEADLFVDSERQRSELFKQPEVLRYMEGLQEALGAMEVVGKSNALTDVVKTVHRELLLGADDEFRIPDTSEAVAQTLLTYQNSHRPYDLWHFVTPDYRKATIWVQLTSGDNVDMSAVVDAVDAYVADNPPPMGLEHRWYGLTYINVVWQQKMVSGMGKALLGSFVIVLAMMVFLFRSLWWGVLSMVPLTVSVGLIYGVVGLIGKDYDMPVAVLSSLSLGLAVDYAIHFLARSRAAFEAHGTWPAALESVFGEPARAIGRNAIVLGVGFLPLLLAPLIPYYTVGVLIAAILATAGLATLVILPAAITLLESRLFNTKGVPHASAEDRP